MAVQLKRTSVLKVALIVIVMLCTETTYATPGIADTEHFSQNQIKTFIGTVTTELQLSKSWKSNFAHAAASKLYCNSVVLGEGVREGNHGLYAWFTCSAMHRLNVTKRTNTSLTCTGFSAPVWIQPTSDSVNFQAVPYLSLIHI